MSQSNNLRDPVRSVFLLHITDHFVAPVLTKIDVKVRHRDAFWIEETFKQQTKPQGVKIGDGQRQATTDPALILGPAPLVSPALLPTDKVRNNDEIAENPIFYNAELIRSCR